jgi:urease accessory protein
VVDGRTRCTEIRSDPPLTLRETPDGVHLVASGAGPVGGDELRLAVRVGPGATLDLRSVAASRVHPGPAGRPSHLIVDVEVAEGASLTWRPQPAILVRGCDHHVTTRIRLGPGASLVWREEVVLGRHDEPSGSALQRLRVDGPDGPVLRTDLAIGPRWPGSLGPGGVGPAGAVGTVLVVGAGRSAQLDELADRAGLRWASSTLGRAATGVADDRSDAVLLTAVADSAGVLAGALDEVLAPVRPVAAGQGATNTITSSSGGDAS